MKTKILIIVMHLIMMIAVLVMIGSFVCFAFFPKTTGTVTAINAYPDDTVVEFTYVVDNESYVRKQDYSGSSVIRFGDQRNIWYYAKQPDISIMPRDFAAYYIIAAIFGVGEIAYFFGRKARKAKRD